MEKKSVPMTSYFFFYFPGYYYSVDSFCYSKPTSPNFHSR